MKKILLASLSLVILFGSCKKKNNNNTTPTTDTVVVLKGDIATNTTLSASKKYRLEGFVYVTDGATLTIEAGTVIRGDKASKGTLVITRGSKINAVGTSTSPIIFTSNASAGARSQGDWGGIIILGKAPINPSGGEAKIEGGLTATGGGDEKKYIYYGGTDAADNSGMLKYVRIEFGGIAFSPDNEINGLTMGGVGSGTTISYVQVYRSGDDSYEWFGGTVNCDHLVATYGWDDDFDTDFGFSGRVQFGVSQRAKAVADVSGSNGFESDNDGNGTTATPQTKAIFSNMTIIGPTSITGASGINANFQHGAQIRRNSSESIINSVFVGFPIGCYIDGTKGTQTVKNVTSGSLVFKNNIIAGCATPWKIGPTPSSTDSASFVALKGMNTVLAAVEDVKLADINKFSATLQTPAGIPSYLLASGSPAASGADFTGFTGFEAVTYRGAFDGTNNWLSGWTTFDAENSSYE